MRRRVAPRWSLWIVLAWLSSLAGLPAVAIPAVAQGCVMEAEPNDTVDQAPSSLAVGCAKGSLPDDDPLDLWVWSITPDDAQRPWRLTLTGLPGVITGLSVVRVTSDVGRPVAVTGTLVALEVDPGAQGPSVSDALLLTPGTYLVGVARSPDPLGGPLDALMYQLDLVALGPLPPSLDVEDEGPDPVATAQGVFAGSGTLTDGDTDRIAWTIPDDTPPGTWSLAAHAGVESGLVLRLLDVTGSSLSMTQAGPDGRALLPDLRLTPGRYIVEVAGSGVWELAGSMAPDDAPDAGPRYDPEPNDTEPAATTIALGHVGVGRLTPDDRDVWRFTVDDVAADRLLAMRILTPTGPSRTMCLERPVDVAVWQTIRCATVAQGATWAALNGLLLPAGEYWLAVTGTGSLADPYYLRVDATSAPAADHEVEPNDTLTDAVPMVAGAPMHGALDEQDQDVYVVRVEGIPRLWEVRATAPGGRIHGLQLLGGDGASLTTGDVSADGSSAVLTDLSLIPGDHLIALQGSAPDYRLELVPIGEPAADAEREPNDDAARSDRIVIGQTRSGRLPRPTDVDVYRFTVAGRDRVRIRIEPPPDTEVGWRLERDMTWLAGERAPGFGATTDRVVTLEPGDHLLTLSGGPSEGTYQVSITRQDPFVQDDDREPNDDPSLAAAMPDTGVVAGRADAPGEYDWYALGTSSDPVTLRIRVEGRLDQLSISDGTSDQGGVMDTQTGILTAGPLPAGVPLYVMVRPRTDYQLAIERDGVFPTLLVPAPLPVQAVLRVPDSLPATVAAYQTVGQTLRTLLDLRSTCARPRACH